MRGASMIADVGTGHVADHRQESPISGAEAADRRMGWGS